MRIFKKAKKKIVKPFFKWLACQFTFQKILIACLVYKGVCWVDQSYALAWAGYTEIASDLSQKALVELLGVALLYSVKSLFENLSKNNVWPDKPCDIPLKDTNDENLPVG